MKKYICLLMVFIMIFGLTACGQAADLPANFDTATRSDSVVSAVSVTSADSEPVLSLLPQPESIVTVKASNTSIEIIFRFIGIIPHNLNEVFLVG